MYPYPDGKPEREPLNLPPGCKLRPDGLVELPRFAILDEHEITENGQPVQIDRRRLQEIAKRCNARLSRTGDMAPIVVGHTREGAPEQHQPRIVGFATNYTVEPFARTGKSAIFVTPLAKPEELDTFRQFPRRSVELWLNPDDIDPIALLGATTPKRDLGLHKFARHHAPGQSRRWYSIDADRDDAADTEDDMADEKKPKKSPMDGEDGGDADTGGDGDDAILNRLVAKFQNMDWVKKLMALADQMEGEESPGGEDPEGMGPDGGAGAPSDMGGPGGDPELEQILGGHGGEHDGGPHKESGVAGCYGAEPMSDRAYARQYSYGSYDPADRVIYPPFYPPPTPPAKPRGAVLPPEKIKMAKIEAENAALQQRIAQLEAVNKAAEIDAELADLARAFVIRPDIERPRLLKMSREQRAVRYDEIEATHRRADTELPNDGRLPVAGEQQTPLKYGRGAAATNPQRSGITPELVARATALATQRTAQTGSRVTVQSVVHELMNGTGTNGTAPVSVR